MSFGNYLKAHFVSINIPPFQIGAGKLKAPRRMVIMEMAARKSRLEFPSQDTILCPAPDCTLEPMQALNEKRLTTGKPPSRPHLACMLHTCSCCLLLATSQRSEISVPSYLAPVPPTYSWSYARKTILFFLRIIFLKGGVSWICHNWY